MSERWTPEVGEAYYFMDSFGVVNSYEWRNDPTDRLYYNRGNCFRTEREAGAAAEKVKALLLSLHYNGTSTANSETLKDTFTEYLKKCAEPQNTSEKNKLPKLTAEVFDRPNCPEWAKYAAVDRGGVACYYDQEPICDRVERWLRGRNGEHFMAILNNQFDATDWQNSLVERPVKKPELPNWCKPGKWVYADGKGAYGKVYESKVYEGKDYIRVKMENGRSVNQISEYKIDELSRARLRPWTAREAIGKTICWRGDYSFQENVAIINAVDCDGDLMGDLIGNTNLKDLVRECFYQLDGSPGGVLEYLENGEWVK